MIAPASGATTTSTAAMIAADRGIRLGSSGELPWVRMIPCPTENGNNTCPEAALQTAGSLNTLVSVVNGNSIPSAAPSRTAVNASSPNRIQKQVRDQQLRPAFNAVPDADRDDCADQQRRDQ